MKRAVVLFLSFFALVVNFAFAQKPTVVTDNDPGWHKIGEITASFKMDNESIIVYGRDEFTKIKFKVTDAPINIEKVTVFYEEGSSQELSVANELQAGGETRVIDLEGTNKELEKVVFTYKTMPNYDGDKATVELYGLKTRQDKSDAFRDDNDDNDGETEVEEEARQAGDEINEEADEAGDEIHEESREARDEVKEETREARDEYKQERREAKEEYKEEKREAKQEAAEAESDLEQGAENVGDDVSEAAVNAASHIKDKVYVDKVGPKGQTIYIDKHDKYYYVSDEGKKIYITKLEMKDKPNKD
jgi:F0F1-type ATP synthase membrane subunit b/b'